MFLLPSAFKASGVLKVCKRQYTMQAHEIAEKFDLTVEIIINTVSLITTSVLLSLI